MDHPQISREQGFLSGLSQLHVAVVDFGCKLTCETAALSSLSSACSQAPGEVLDQDLVVAETCACYRSGNCWLTLRSYRWWALNGQRLRLFKQLWEVFCMARPQHRQKFLRHIVGNANLGGSPWCNEGFNNPPSHREQRG